MKPPSRRRRGGGGHHLDVKQCEPMSSQVLHQAMERHLGGVVNAMEHGFADEQAADGDPVDAAHQFSVLPAFHAVGDRVEVAK